jgi:hypothetical protein
LKKTVSPIHAHKGRARPKKTFVFMIRCDYAK